ncbi:MAG: hypothetical protein EU541_03915 [Promethearchaeota archaeon]|nr:MAG: hypothetical protein EU541_03915 [Candidatus Lokiarchaeota archaeon]
MGFSLKELTFKGKYLLYLTEQEYAGPWFGFKIRGEKIGTLPILLKNIEPTPIYKLVNSRKGRYVDRITLDFDIKEYLKKLIKAKKLKPITFSREDLYVRLYIDVFNKPKVPYINTFFTFKNISEFDLIDFNIFFIFDFDINGLEGFDNDYAEYDEENDIIYQYDKSNLYGGFSPISKATNYEACLTNEFSLDQEKMALSNTIPNTPGEILSALQIKFKTLEPEQTFQTALTISGGSSKEELIQNIIQGKSDSIKYLSQVNRNVKSNPRNAQQEAFEKINLQEAKDCD